MTFSEKRILAIPLIFIGIILFYQFGRGTWHPVIIKFIDKKTVAEVIETYHQPTLEKLAPLFNKQGISYPPKKLALVAFKDTNILELWGANNDLDYKLITNYPIQAASGKLGPKLREGDKQVPEGIYKNNWL